MGIHLLLGGIVIWVFGTGIEYLDSVGLLQCEASWMISKRFTEE